MLNDLQGFALVVYGRSPSLWMQHISSGSETTMIMIIGYQTTTFFVKQLYYLSEKES